VSCKVIVDNSADVARNVGIYGVKSSKVWKSGKENIWQIYRIDTVRKRRTSVIGRQSAIRRVVLGGRIPTYLRSGGRRYSGKRRKMNEESFRESLKWFVRGLNDSDYTKLVGKAVYEEKMVDGKVLRVPPGELKEKKI